MRLQELLEAQIIGRLDFSSIKPGKTYSHGLLGPVTVVKIEGNSVVVKTKQGNTVKVSPGSLSID
jgi:hypothetical protein